MASPNAPSPEPKAPVSGKKFSVRTHWTTSALHVDEQLVVTSKASELSEADKDRALAAAKQCRARLVVEEVSK